MAEADKVDEVDHEMDNFPDLFKIHPCSNRLVGAATSLIKCMVFEFNHPAIPSGFCSHSSIISAMESTVGGDERRKHILKLTTMLVDALKKHKVAGRPNSNTLQQNVQLLYEADCNLDKVIAHVLHVDLKPMQ